MRHEYPDKKASRPVAFLMMFHGVDMMQKIEMKMVALAILMYLGAMP